MIKLRALLIALLTIVLVAPRGAAQAAVNEPEIWRAMVEKLEPNAFVRVRLTDGTSVKGHLVGASESELRLTPKTRIAVPLRHVAFADIVSIERQREPIMNPGAKVLLGVGIGVATFWLVAVLAIAGLD